MRRLLREIIPVLILPLVAAGGFYELLLHADHLIVDGERPILDHANPLGTRGIGNDLTLVFLPRYHAIVGRLRTGRGVPFWDATGFGGRPLVGNPQAGLFYPPVWAAWWAGRPSALGWLTLGHLVWGGVGAYVLLRSLKVSTPAAVLAAACFELSPYLTAHTFEGHYPHVWSASWYPWAFWALGMARQGQFGGVLALPVILAFCFLTGHPQEWYLLVLALSAWAVADAVVLWRAGQTRRAAGRALLWAGLLGVSLAFCAAELLPELAAQPWLLRRSTIPLRMVSRYYLHALNLFQLVSPFALGKPHDYIGHDNYWETLLSVGLLPLVLAAVGAARHRDRALSRGWLVLAVACLVFACGRRLGLYTLAHALLPGMNRFRVPARTLFLASLGASVLAGLGLDTLLARGTGLSEWERVRDRVRRTFVTLGLVLLGVLIVSKTVLPVSPYDSGAGHWDDRAWRALVTTAGYAPAWLAVAGTLLIVSLERRGRISRPLAGLLLGAVAVVEVTLSAQGLLVLSPAARFDGPGPLAARLRRDATTATGPARVASVPRLLPDLAAVSAGVEKTDVNDSFQIQHAADLYERLYPFLEERSRPPRPEGPMDEAAERFRADVARAVLDRFSVRSVLTARPFPSLGLDQRDAHASDSVRWLHNPTALPRAYAVPTVARPGPRGTPPWVRLTQIDARQAVMMDRDPLPDVARQPFTPAVWLSDDPDRLDLRVSTRAPGLLVVSTTWMPGWSALVDGREERVLRGNHCQQVVPIRAAGEHRIVLSYTPPGFWAGAALSLASVTAWLVVGLALLVRRRSRRRAVQAPNSGSRRRVRQVRADAPPRMHPEGASART
jgi:hypothetical protein